MIDIGSFPIGDYSRIIESKHEREKIKWQYLEHALKRSSVNSFLTAEFDKCAKNKDDAISRKLCNAQVKVRGMLKAEFMK